MRPFIYDFSKIGLILRIIPMSLQSHIFIDQLDLPENANCVVNAYITLGKNYIHYSLLNKQNGNILFTKSIYQDAGIIGQSDFDSLLSDPILRNASSVAIAIDTAKQTLIPNSLLDETNYASYFKSIFEIEKEEEIYSQKIDSEITELYVIKKATISYVKNEFKQIAFYSNSACLLSAYSQLVHKLNFSHIAFIHASHDSFFFGLFIQKKLHYAQLFDLRASSDILYCLLNLLQLQKIEMSEVGIYLTGFSYGQNEIADLLGSYFSLDTLDLQKIDSEPFGNANFPLHILFHQYSLISCES